MGGQDDSMIVETVQQQQLTKSTLRLLIHLFVVGLPGLIVIISVGAYSCQSVMFL